MSGTVHTPGPWFFHILTDGWCISTAATRRAAGSHNAVCGAEADYDPLWNGEPSAEDARLIAAAPSLLEALEECAADLNNAAGQFESYADLHRAKGTEDGDKKAARNQLWADTLSAQCVKLDRLIASTLGKGEEG